MVESIAQWVSGFNPEQKESQGDPFILIDVVGLYSPKQAQLLLGFKFLTNVVTFCDIQSDWSLLKQEHRAKQGDNCSYICKLLSVPFSAEDSLNCVFTFIHKVGFFHPCTQQRIWASKKLCLAQRLSWQNMALTSRSDAGLTHGLSLLETPWVCSISSIFNVQRI